MVPYGLWTLGGTSAKNLSKSCGDGVGLSRHEQS